MKKKILCLIFSVLFLLSAFVFPGAAGSFGTEDINETDVMQDLDRMKFNFGNYPMNKEADYCQLIRFLEYGYDYNGRDDDYELFLYVYNPSGRELVLDSLNQVTMSVRSSTDTALVDYTKYKLSLLSASSQEGYENVFYKFRVILPSSFMNKLEQERRVYAISEIELHWTGQAKATAINVSGRYTCTGYIPYHGRNTSDAANTLSTAVTDLFTLDLQLNGTTWKTNSSDRGQGFQYEIFSVYFSVPNQVIKKYGDTEDPTKGLYQIDGVYDEYRVNGLLTDNSDCYEWLNKFVGKEAHKTELMFYAGLSSVTDYMYGFNTSTSGLIYGLYKYGAYELCTVFQDVDGMSRQEFETALREYQNHYGSFYLKALENGLTPGNKHYTVSVEDGDIAKEISSYSSNHSWFETLLEGGFGWYDKSETYGQCLPIVTVPWDEVFFAKTDDAISEALFIDKGDVSHLRNFTNEAYLKDETTYLMRFAVRDYYCDKAELYEVDNLYTGGLFDRKFMFSDNYYYQKTIFNNFDVLSLTYEDAYSEKTLIPVAALPIDIEGNISSPSNVGGFLGGLTSFWKGDDGEGGLKDFLDWLGQFKLIYILIAGVLVFAFLKWIFKKLGLSFGKLLGGIGKGIGSIFRGVGKAVSGVLDRREKKRADIKEEVRWQREETRKDQEELRKQREESRKDREEARKDRDELRRARDEFRKDDDNRRRNNEDRRKESAERRAQEEFNIKHSHNKVKEESHEKKD